MCSEINLNWQNLSKVQYAFTLKGWPGTPYIDPLKQRVLGWLLIVEGAL